MPLAPLAPFALIVTAFMVFGLAATMNMWLRPLLGGMQNTHGLKKFLLRASGLIALTKGLIWIETKVRSSLSHWAYGHLHVLARWLTAHAAWAKHLAKYMEKAALDDLYTFGYLRHRTIPHEVTRRVAPVKATAHHAAQVAHGADVLGRDTRRITFKGIDKLKKEQGLLAGILLGIDILVKGRHAKAHHRDHAHTIPQVVHGDIPALRSRTRAQGKTLTKHGARIRALEKALVGVLSGALVMRILLKRMPFMRCSNWGRFSRAVKCSHLGFLADLLAVGFVMFAFGDLCKLIGKLAGIARPVIDELVTVLAVTGAALCGGDHTAAGPLPLATTALPQVDNPLTL